MGLEKFVESIKESINEAKTLPLSLENLKYVQDNVKDAQMRLSSDVWESPSGKLWQGNERGEHRELLAKKGEIIYRKNGGEFLNKSESLYVGPPVEIEEEFINDFLDKNYGIKIISLFTPEEKNQRDIKDKKSIRTYTTHVNQIATEVEKLKNTYDKQLKANGVEVIEWTKEGVRLAQYEIRSGINNIYSYTLAGAQELAKALKKYSVYQYSGAYYSEEEGKITKSSNYLFLPTPDLKTLQKLATQRQQ